MDAAAPIAAAPASQGVTVRESLCTELKKRAILRGILTRMSRTARISTLPGHDLHVHKKSGAPSLPGPSWYIPWQPGPTANRFSESPVERVFDTQSVHLQR
jgi:hypothetical protein